MVYDLELPQHVRSFSAQVGAGAQAAMAAGTTAAEHDEGWGGEAAPMADDFDDFDDDLLAQDPWVLPCGPWHSPHGSLRPTLQRHFSQAQ